ncbi:MAG: hypothetical protein H7246_05595 [Phycisphaerae bacterium]|nr:hypothetical protein [Saprospiraceae bacterium]
MKNSIFCSFLILAFAILVLPAQAQNKIKIKDIKGCAFAGTLPKGVAFSASALPGDEAQGLRDTIVSLGGIITDEILLRAADSVKNALATVYENKRYILYNPDFLRQFKQENDASWKAYSVLAHEVGHHALRHNLGETDCNARKKNEREADRYAGMVLRRLCATREQSLAALKSLPSSQPVGSCYPSIVLRKKETGEAFDAQDSIYKAQPKLDPCVEKVSNIQLMYKVPESIKNTNARANVFNDRVEFMIDIPFTRKRSKVFTHIVVDEKAGELTNIKSFRWKDNPYVPGSKTLVWDFKKDGLDRARAEKLGLLNVCSFDKNPARTTKMELLGWGLMTTAGAGLLTWGGITFGQSQDLLSTYKQYTNVSAAQYAPPNNSRTSTKNEADAKLTQSVFVGIAGGVLFTWGLNKLIKRSVRNKRTFILIPNH